MPTEHGPGPARDDANSSPSDAGQSPLSQGAPEARVALETALRRLLAAYGGALQFASEMPFLGRYQATDERGKHKRRWGSRFWTLLYAQNHVRAQLSRIVEVLNLELLATHEEQFATGLRDMRAELKEQLASPIAWTRLKAFLVKLPPVSAAIPILLGALAAYEKEGTLAWGQVVRGLVALSLTAGAVWLLLIWPSIRLGFRIKRAIFAGGIDLRRPLTEHPVCCAGRSFPRRTSTGSKRTCSRASEGERRRKCLWTCSSASLPTFSSC